MCTWRIPYSLSQWVEWRYDAFCSDSLENSGSAQERANGRGDGTDVEASHEEESGEGDLND